jgi:hypothetical protein
MNGTLVSYVETFHYPQEPTAPTESLWTIIILQQKA